MGNTWSQLYPPKPKFTEKDLPDLKGKVFIVTGSNTGIGKELAQLLYGKHAKVYIAARSEDKAEDAITAIKNALPESKGELTFLRLDLSDLTTIKASAQEFLRKEIRLDVLFNNAGVMLPPKGSKTEQGYDLELGTNNIGTFLFTKLLTPILAETAKSAPPGSVRIVWVSSSAAEAFSHKPGGVPIEKMEYEAKSKQYKYGVSKAGNVLHAREFARRYEKEGIISASLNPGNLATDLGRHLNGVQKFILKHFIQHPPILGAYTELFAGFSPDVTAERLKGPEWIVPWGRFLPLRKDIVAACKPKSDGGTGVAQKFWEWTDEQVKQYS